MTRKISPTLRGAGSEVWLLEGDRRARGENLHWGENLQYDTVKSESGIIKRRLSADTLSSPGT
jgi:hypothetical protein